MNLNSKPNHTQRRIVVAGTGAPFSLFAAAMFATPVIVAQKPATIRPHSMLSTNRDRRDRAYDLAIAGGCKDPRKSLVKFGTTVGKRALEAANEFARDMTQAIDGGAWAFPFGATVTGNEHGVLSTSGVS